jgi:hypothetical protein
MSVATDPTSGGDARGSAAGWLKCAVLLLATIVVGLPINNLAVYAPMRR